MSDPKKILECDVDGVILDIWSPVEEEMRRRGIDFSFERDVITYSMNELGNLKPPVLDLLLDADIRYKADFFSGAAAFVRYLSDYCHSNDLSLVFNTHEHNKEAAIAKRDRIISFMEYVGLRKDDYMYQISMTKDKEMLGALIVIDDCVANLMRTHADVRIIFDRFHNRNEADTKLERDNHLFRVRDYKDCISFLDDLIINREDESA